MHFSLPTFAILFASAALASPLADADAGVVPNALQKRGETCAILGNDVQCRKGPGRQYDPVTEFDSDRRIFFGCYKVGESINGNDAWDYSTGWQCYVSARYTGANCNKQTLPRC